MVIRNLIAPALFLKRPVRLFNGMLSFRRRDQESGLQRCAVVLQMGPGVQTLTWSFHFCFADGTRSPDFNMILSFCRWDHESRLQPCAVVLQTRSPDFNVVLSFLRWDQESRLRHGLFVFQLGPGIQTSTLCCRFADGIRSPDLAIFPREWHPQSCL